MRRRLLCLMGIVVAGCGSGAKTVTDEKPAQGGASRPAKTRATTSTPTAAMAHKNAFRMLAQQYGPDALHKMAIERCEQMSVYRFFCVFWGPGANPSLDVVNGVCVEFSPNDSAITNVDIRRQSQCT